MQLVLILIILYPILLKNKVIIYFYKEYICQNLTKNFFVEVKNLKNLTAGESIPLTYLDLNNWYYFGKNIKIPSGTKKNQI